MVDNPIYGEQSGEFNSSVSVAVNPQYGTRAEVIQEQEGKVLGTYEDINDFSCHPKGKFILSCQ